MTFDEAMYQVLQTRRYDMLTGRRVDIWRVIGEWLERLIINILNRLNLPDFGGESWDGGIGIIALVFSVVGAIAVIVAGIVLWRTYKNKRREVRHDLFDIFEELSQKKYTVAELINLSQTAGDKRISVRYRYIAVLLALDERAIIRISPSATNRIILREIQHTAPALAQSFVQVAEVFHQVWFGYKNVDDTGFENFTEAVSNIIGDAQ